MVLLALSLKCADKISMRTIVTFVIILASSLIVKTFDTVYTESEVHKG